MFVTDVIQLDNALVVVTYNVVSEIDMFGSLVDYDVVDRKHGPLFIHTKAYWKGNLHKLIHLVVELPAVISGVRKKQCVLPRWKTQSQHVASKPSHNVIHARIEQYPSNTYDSYSPWYHPSQSGWVYLYERQDDADHAKKKVTGNIGSRSLTLQTFYNTQSCNEVVYVITITSPRQVNM